MEKLLEKSCCCSHRAASQFEEEMDSNLEAMSLRGPLDDEFHLEESSYFYFCLISWDCGMIWTDIYSHAAGSSAASSCNATTASSNSGGTTCSHAADSRATEPPVSAAHECELETEATERNLGHGISIPQERWEHLMAQPKDSLF
ncbi:hypothetical protein MRX96_023484 [Rhipicephalus microplus]